MGADLVFAWPTAEIAVMGAGRRGQHPLLGGELKAAEDRKGPGNRTGGRIPGQVRLALYVSLARGYITDVIEARRHRGHHRLVAAQVAEQT